MIRSRYPLFYKYIFIPDLYFKRDEMDGLVTS